MSDQFPFEQFLNINQQANPNIFNNFSEKINSMNPRRDDNKSEENKDNLFDLSSIENEVHRFLLQTLQSPKYDTFFENQLKLTSLESDVAIFQVSTEFLKNTIESHYLELIDRALSQTLGKKYNIEIKAVSIPETTPKETEVPTAKKLKSAHEASFTLDLNSTNSDLLDLAESKYIEHVNPAHHGIIIDKHKTFDNFIIGPSNNMACATTRHVAQNPGKSGKYPCLYIYSNSGLGKTHLLHAVANGIKNVAPHMVICLITARDFMTEMIQSIQENKISEFRSKYSEKIDVLMIDDIHELKDKQGTQNEFFHIFNELHMKGKQLIFTSDKQPKEIDGIEERIKTRLQWGLVIDIQRPDLETRIAILKRKADELDLYVQDDVINLIASSIKTSIRELEGSLIKLSAFADVMDVEIDIEMVKDLLNLNDLNSTKKITLEDIAKCTSQYFKIPLIDLKSKVRSKEIAKARHVAMYLSRKILNATQQEIGKFYGGRDHSSVIHAVKAISTKIKNDSQLSKDVIYIESNLN